MKFLTIYTPAYNRGELLSRVYESLVKQTCGDFVWMIVDDGSTDGTEEIVKGFINDNKVEICYIKKQNGGKHTATNEAFKSCFTPYIMVALDSDDYLRENAVEIIFDSCKKYPGMAGYVFSKEDAQGKVLSSYSSEETKFMSWQDAVCGGFFDGEALLVLKSDYARNFSYPVIEGESFFTEAYVYLQMTEPFYWSREVVYTAEYLDDGYTKNILTSFRENPVCYEMYNNLRLSLFKTFVKKLKFGAYYIAFSLLSGKKKIVKSASKPGFALLGFVPGFLFCLYLKKRK